METTGKLWRRWEQLRLGRLPPEQTFEGGPEPIRYLYQPGRARRLLVGFSGFQVEGDPPYYNYALTLARVPGPKVFILDDHGPMGSGGSRGCYYLGRARRFTVEQSVVALLNELLAREGLTFEDVTTFGSSKGGSAAVYFGMKYGAGRIVAGAPQVFLGRYLRDAAPEVGEYIAGGRSDDDRRFLDRLILDQVKPGPRVQIHVGRDDRHYPRDVMPLVERLNGGAEIDLGDYGEHADTGTYFAPYLEAQLRD